MKQIPATRRGGRGFARIYKFLGATSYGAWQNPPLGPPQSLEFDFSGLEPPVRTEGAIIMKQHKGYINERIPEWGVGSNPPSTGRPWADVKSARPRSQQSHVRVTRRYGEYYWPLSRCSVQQTPPPIKHIIQIDHEATRSTANVA